MPAQRREFKVSLVPPRGSCDRWAVTAKTTPATLCSIWTAMPCRFHAYIGERSMPRSKSIRKLSKRGPGRPLGSKNKRKAAVKKGLHGRKVARRKPVLRKGAIYDTAAQRIVHDEVWVARDGRHIQVQDLSLEHAHNIIRMMLRAQRINRVLADARSVRQRFLQQLDLDTEVMFSNPEDQ